VLDEAAKRTAARIAVAEVQKQHAVWSMAQLRFEVHRALPVLPAGTDGQAVVDEVAQLAVGGRAGTEVVQVTAPDIADVSSLGVRASDGGSIYRPPNADRYCTLAHLDAEAQIIAVAMGTMAQLIDAGQARAAAGRTDLTAEQRDAVIMMLTATTAATVLIAPAGAGKTHTMEEFARLWMTFTGRRVIGLTTSTNAARVLAHEGLAESYNIAAFLGKIKGSDELRRPVPLHRDDVLVLDEASQLATADLAMIVEAARHAGARIIATGDIAQLGAVEAGGMFAMLAAEVPAVQLHEVRRFAAEWEREASVRLRDGDRAAAAVYDRHGRIRGADHEAAYQRGVGMWLADHLRGKDVLLLAGSNAEAADLSRRVQARLVQLGTVGPPAVVLADGNHAGTGDLIRARLNTKIDAAGRTLSNRDTLKVTGWRGPDAEVRRQRLDGTWTGPFKVPRSYLADSAELAYAGNVHVAQGRTVDTAHLLVTATLSRQALYVGMTRGRESNTAHVVTGKTAPAGTKPYQQATAESVLAAVLQRDGDDLSATGHIRQAQDWAGGTGHLLQLWSAAVREALYPAIDEQITARLTDSEAWRYQREPSRPVLQHALREAQVAGHDIGAIIDRITAAPMDGARSVASALHGRLLRLPLPTQDHGVAWAQRTPESAPALAHELAAGLDDRRRELGRRALADPEPWLTRHLGSPPGPDASPVLREDYTWRAGTAAAYREALGVTDPQQAVSFGPHPGPELETLRTDTLRALEIADEQAEIRAMSRGGLEAQLRQAERAQAAAPPVRSSLLRLTAQAEADAWQQAADAAAEHDQVRAENARALAAALAAEASRLEAASTRYEEWSARTASTRELAGKAKAELQRRGQDPSAREAPGPQSMATWWQEFQAHADAVDRAIEHEHQAAISTGQPWPPERKPETGHKEPDAAAPAGEPHFEQSRPGTPGASTEPEPSAFIPGTAESEAAGPVLAKDGRAARLDELQAHADEAAGCIDAEQAGLNVSSEHTARIRREAQAEPEADRQAETPYEMEL
jgi:AAA domain